VLEEVVEEAVFVATGGDERSQAAAATNAIISWRRIIDRV
jgi:hypothetical protein